MRILFIGFCIILILSGCAAEYLEWQPNENMPQLRAEYQQARSVWESLEVYNYQFYGINHTYYPEGVKIKVRNGAAEKVVRSHSGEPAYFPAETVDEFFDFIDAAYLDEENHMRSNPKHIGTDFIVSYDPQYGYPVEFEIINKTARCGFSNTRLEINEFRLPEEEKWRPNENTEKMMAELLQRRADWEKLNIQNYQYTIQELYDSTQYVYWDYRSRTTIKNGQFHETVGLQPVTFGGNTRTIGNIFNDIYAFFLKEQIGWSSASIVGMDFTIKYDSQYNFPVFFDYENIYHELPPWMSSRSLAKGYRITEFKLLK